MGNCPLPSLTRFFTTSPLPVMSRTCTHHPYTVMHLLVNDTVQDNSKLDMIGAPPAARAADPWACLELACKGWQSSNHSASKPDYNNKVSSGMLAQGCIQIGNIEQ